MSWYDDEVARMRAHLLILGRRKADDARTALLLALADVGRLPIAKVELQSFRLDVLICLAEGRLVFGRSHLAAF